MELRYDNIERAIRLPVELRRMTIKLGKFAVRRIANAAIVNMQTECHIAERLRAEHLLHKARVGAQTMERGIESGDYRLLEVGEATIALAAIAVVDEVGVVDDISRQVADIAIERAVEPQSNSLLPEETAARARFALARLVS